MSKNIFINNLDTYVSQAIFKELRNDEPDPETGEPPENANNIFGTYIGKDSSNKPDGIKKMLKVSHWRLQPHFWTSRTSNQTNLSALVEIETEPCEELRLQMWPNRLWLARW